MTIGNEVRLKGAYIVKCESVEKDEEGNVTTIHCTYWTRIRGVVAGSIATGK